MYHFWTQNTFTVSCPMARGGGGGGKGGIWVNYFCWVHVCACMCLASQKSILWPIDVPILSIFEDPIFIHFLFVYLPYTAF